jgi:hypothetical protein
MLETEKRLAQKEYDTPTVFASSASIDTENVGFVDLAPPPRCFLPRHGCGAHTCAARRGPFLGCGWGQWKGSRRDRRYGEGRARTVLSAIARAPAVLPSRAARAHPRPLML